MRRRVIGAALLVGMLVSSGAGVLAAGPADARPVLAQTNVTFEPLKVGSKGTRVKQVQERLVNLGHSIVADGVYGPKTRLAVRRFQRSKKMLVDGVVGPRTWKALGLESSSPEPELPAVAPGSYRHSNANVERWHAHALAAGWTEDQWKRLSCIMYRESKGLPAAKNPRTSATGLLQIMWSVHARWIGGKYEQLLDGPTNLKIGKALYDRAGGWRPWASTVGGC
jgi:hypothetical protein